MKTKSFTKARALTGLFLILIGLFVGLLSLGAFSTTATSFAQALQKYKIITRSNDPLVPVGFDCSKIHELGIDRQENMRAGALMIACGQSSGGSPTSATSTLGPVGRLVQKLLAPLAYGASDVDLVTGPEAFPNVTQSETYTLANPDNSNEVFVAYNDSRGRNANPINISGASISTDGGTTFTRLTKTNGQSPFDNTVGDPVAFYYKPSATWSTVWLDLACGGQGLGGYSSTTPSDPNSWTHFCVHNNSADDRPSGWVDNNPSSPFYGRMYVSWNDFNVGVGALSVTYSSDGGVTWHSPILVSNASTFIRDVQITGDLAGNGIVYLAGMDEGGGGFPHNDVNYLYKSTDGGNTWTNTYTGPSFPGPGVTASGYFACMFSDNGGYWRHEGWGEPAAFNNVVHLVYAQQGAASDAGDVYYIRSTDGGVTFSAPFKLNSDSTTRPQWMPNLSVSPAGTLLATWYDGRDSASCTYGNPSVPCYRMYSRKSTDNGATWLPDDTLSDVVTPLPAQPDPGIQPTYAGDYDYGTALLSKHVTSWTDGRVTISGTSQQDAFTDRELVGFGVTTTTPGCGSVVSTQPTDFVLNLTDPVNPSTVQATDFTVNGTPADSFVLGGGNTQITFHFNSTPVSTQGLQTMDMPAGAINRASDNSPNLEFNCTFRWDATLLQVTTTNPVVGGTFSPAAPGDYTYDVNFNEAVDPASVQTGDLTTSGTAGGSVTAVSVINGNTTAEFTVHFTFGGSFTANIAAGAITDAFGNPGAAFSGSYTVEGCPAPQYAISQGTDTIVPGTTDTGNHCDDCDTVVTLPFSFQLYDQTYTSVNVSSNGRLDFVTANEPGGYLTNCLPAPPNVGPYDFTIFPLWHDQRTDIGLSGCANFPNGRCGVFTSVSGTSPNRIFNIEFRTVRFADNTQTENYEVRLYENLALNQRFDVIYGTTTGITGSDTAGVQGNSAGGFFTEDFCNLAPPLNASRTYTLPSCGGTLTLVSAVSRKTHGPRGTFDLPLVLTPASAATVEPRAGGPRQVIFTFSENVFAADGTIDANNFTITNAAFGSATVSGSQITLQLIQVVDQSVVNIVLNGLVDANGNPLTGNNDVAIRALYGDADQNQRVGQSDFTLVQQHAGQAVNSSNFLIDMSLDGYIDKPDEKAVKSNKGHSVP